MVVYNCYIDYSAALWPGDAHHCRCIIAASPPFIAEPHLATVSLRPCSCSAAPLSAAAAIAAPCGSADLLFLSMAGEEMSLEAWTAWTDLDMARPSEPLPASVTFVDADGDRSTINLEAEAGGGTRRLSWHSGGQCHLESIRILEYEAATNTITAPENARLIAKLVDPPIGPARELLLRKITRMARVSGLDLRGFPSGDVPDESASDASPSGDTEDSSPKILLPLPELMVDMLQALISTDTLPLSIRDRGGRLPVQLAQQHGASREVLDFLIRCVTRDSN